MKIYVVCENTLCHPGLPYVILDVFKNEKQARALCKRSRKRWWQVWSLE